MSMGNDVRKGKKGSGDAYPKGVFSRMGQGEMKRRPLERGLFRMMGQGETEATGTRMTTGKEAAAAIRGVNFGDTLSKRGKA